MEENAFGTNGTTARTLLHRLRAHALGGPERVAFQQIDRELCVAREVTYGGLWRQVQCGAAALRAVMEPGERVLIFFEPGLEPLVDFLAVLAARMIAVPAALPPAVSAALAQRKPAATRRVEAVANLLRDAGPRVVLAAAESHPEVAALLTGCAHPPRLLPREELRCEDALAGDDEDTLPSPEDLAFLQYTSGSTALPKGVAVTHANLAHNLAAITPFVRSHRESVFISWLPMFHDMGLVGDALHPLWAGCRCVKLPPADFLRRPRLWMAAAAKFGGTITGGPNFAYALAATHAERGGESLDLSRLEVAYCGSEPIRAETMDAFAAAHAPHGLRPGALFPCYGMAESTLLVAGVKGDAPFATAAHESGGRVVSCGRAAEAEVTIVNPATNAALPDGEVGEIVVRSRSISPGYWCDLKNGARTFPDEPRTLRTGDLGFLRGGELHVSGRIKHTLIVRGRKFVAEDVEHLLERELAATVERGRAVVFPVRGADGEEVIVLIEGGAEDEAAVAATVRATLAEACGFLPRHVALVRPGSVPRTTSGKLQRHFAAELWLAKTASGTTAK